MMWLYVKENKRQHFVPKFKKHSNLAKATLTIFFGPRIPTGVFQPCRRKKKNLTSQIFSYRTFFADFADFFYRNTTDLVTKIPTLFDMSEGKKTKNIGMSVFFSCLAHSELVGGIVDQRI